MRLCAVHDDAALQARAALAPVFNTLRRMLMQLCGLLLLDRGRSPATREAIAVSLAALRVEYAEAADRLNALQAVDLPERGAIIAAARDVRIVIGQLERSLAASGGGERAAAVLPLLQRAQRLLLAASDDQAGMAMVGFAHACCCAPAALSCS